MPTKKTKVKAPKKQKKTEAIDEPIKEPEFINLEDYLEQGREYKKLLMIFIIIGIIIVGGFWLWSAKIKINSTIESVNYEEITTEIKKSLGLFDEELKNRTEPKNINIEELEKISEQIENELQEDVSLWPTIEISQPKISLQYPIDWQKEISANTIKLYPKNNEANNNLKLNIEEVGYKSGKIWSDWLNKQLTSDYQPQTNYTQTTSTDYELFAFYNTKTTTTEIVFIKFNQLKKAFKLTINDQLKQATTTKLIITSIKPVK